MNLVHNLLEVGRRDLQDWTLELAQGSQVLKGSRWNLSSLDTRAASVAIAGRTQAASPYEEQGEGAVAGWSWRIQSKGWSGERAQHPIHSRNHSVFRITHTHSLTLIATRSNQLITHCTATHYEALPGSNLQACLSCLDFTALQHSFRSRGAGRGVTAVNTHYFTTTHHQTPPRSADGTGRLGYTRRGVQPR